MDLDAQNALVGRADGVGVWLFGLGLALNQVVFTRNFDTPEEVAEYLANGAVVGRLGLISVAIAGLGLVVFLSGYRARLPQPTHWMASVAFGGGLVGVATMWASSTVDLGIIDTVGGEVDFPLYLVLRGEAHFQSVLMAVAFLLMLAAVYKVERHVGVLPRWARLLTGATFGLMLVLILFGASVLLLVPWSLAIGAAVMQKTSQQPEDEKL